MVTISWVSGGCHVVRQEGVGGDGSGVTQCQLYYGLESKTKVLLGL